SALISFVIPDNTKGSFTLFGLKSPCTPTPITMSLNSDFSNSSIVNEPKGHQTQLAEVISSINTFCLYAPFVKSTSSLIGALESSESEQPTKLNDAIPNINIGKNFLVNIIVSY